MTTEPSGTSMPGVTRAIAPTMTRRPSLAPSITGTDADEAVVADLGAVHDGAVRDRAVVADCGAPAAADVDDGSVLDVAAAAQRDAGALGADHRVGPEAAALTGGYTTVDAGGGVEVGGAV